MEKVKSKCPANGGHSASRGNSREETRDPRGGEERGVLGLRSAVAVRGEEFL